MLALSGWATTTIVNAKTKAIRTINGLLCIGQILINHAKYKNSTNESEYNLHLQSNLVPFMPVMTCISYLSFYTPTKLDWFDRGPLVEPVFYAQMFLDL